MASLGLAATRRWHIHTDRLLTPAPCVVGVGVGLTLVGFGWLMWPAGDDVRTDHRHNHRGEES